MNAASVRWARAVLLGLVCVALYRVHFTYEARYLGVEFLGSLAHLHAGLLLAIALLVRDPLALRVSLLANWVAWMAIALPRDPTVDMFLYGAVSILVNYAVLRGCARVIGWPRSGTRRQLALGDLPALAAVCMVGYPLLMALQPPLLEWMLRGNYPLRAESLNPMVQTFFAKHFGALVLALPLIVAATHGHARDQGMRWWQAALPWRVLLVGVAGPAVMLGLAAHWGGRSGPWVDWILDGRLLLMSLLVAASLRLDERWSMPLLVCVQVLIVAAVSARAHRAEQWLEIIDLARTGVELLILQCLVLSLLLTHRARTRSMAVQARRSRRDPMTGLPNLIALRERADREPGVRALGCVVLDRSERVAGGLGLRAQAALVGGAARHLGPLAETFQISSSELAIVPHPAPGEAPPWEAILQSLHQFEFEWGGQKVRVMPYLGIATSRASTTHIDALVLDASRAAHQARHRGESGSWEIGKDDVAAPMPERLQRLLHDSHVLAQLRSDRVELDLQPIHPLHGPCPAGVWGEVLCRLRAADGTLMPPTGFLPGLLGDGRMSELDGAVIRRLCAWLESHREALSVIGRLSINVSGQSLSSAHFARVLFRQLEAIPLPAACLCIEVTDTSAIQDMTDARRLLNGLRERGHSIALDDFGVGYQSCERLKQIPSDIIKIDGSFVLAMSRSARDVALVRAAIAVAGAFGAKTVAKSIETSAAADALRALRVDHGQGFHFGAPRPLAEYLRRDVPQTGGTEPEMA